MFRHQLKRVGIAAILVITIYFIFFDKGALTEPLTLFPQWNYVKPGCNEHHIVIVLGGQKTISLATALFKSILYHHRGPLVFHFITDNYTRRVLPTLFDTWNLPSVRYHIYELEKFKDQVDWVPNSHYSSIYGIIRLVIPDILPRDVKEVLFLDTDIIVLDDVSPMFDAFKGTSNSTLLAMAENISPWYIKHKNWPARGRGFNAGVMLLHLERMRKANWGQIWKSETKRILQKIDTGNDQDILNALTVAHPAIVVSLPCEYNFQLGSAAQPATCQKETRLVKMAHFNSQAKMNLRSKYAVHFARYFSIFQSMDGYVFRLRNQCDNSKSLVLNDLKEMDRDCGDLIEAIQTKYRTHLYFNGFLSSNATDDVTLVTQLSVDKLHIFSKVLDAWEGPVSAAIYCTDAELTQLETFMQAAQIIKRKRKNVVFHAVFKTGNYYPINYLRNVALNASHTEFQYVADADFIPSEGLYKDLREAVKQKLKKKVLVVPAFELLSTDAVPNSQDDLISMWDEGKIRPFGADSSSDDKNNNTDYKLWKLAGYPFEVEWNAQYDVFAVSAKISAPIYEDRFIGFGWSKVSHATTLHDAGYQYFMLPSAFTVHHPHSPSFDVSRFGGSALYKKCLKSLQRQFAKDSKFKALAQKAIDSH